MLQSPWFPNRNVSPREPLSPPPIRRYSNYPVFKTIQPDNVLDATKPSVSDNQSSSTSLNSEPNNIIEIQYSKAPSMKRPDNLIGAGARLTPSL